ncbi:transcription factor with AP2 domain [Babesia caballi]|uniref:Transcription factor with AP2 domain n=1 Tax=Babesia caballi TaxID=5871 RepID=A0AAV4M0T9_BABCB|nr:transcription factor with AP2 domain [Babesia caballi]
MTGTILWRRRRVYAAAGLRAARPIDCAHTPAQRQKQDAAGTMKDEKPEHAANECYEALLDLKGIFPSWSDHQENFHYHWREILGATTKGKEAEQETVGFYRGALKELIDSRGEGLESQLALALIARLDQRRKERDESFEDYNVEDLLGKDTSAIRPKPPVKKQPVQRRPAAEVTTEVVPDGGHVYGTRTRSRRLQAQESEGDQGAKLEYSSAGLGTHLKKGFFSDYVWDFLVPTGEDNEYDNEIDEGAREAGEEAESTPKKTKRPRK